MKYKQNGIIASELQAKQLKQCPEIDMYTQRAGLRNGTLGQYRLQVCWTASAYREAHK